MKVLFVHKEKEPRIRDEGDGLKIGHLIYVELEGGCGFAYFEEDGGPPPKVGENAKIVCGIFGEPGLQLLWPGRRKPLLIVP